MQVQTKGTQDSKDLNLFIFIHSKIQNQNKFSKFLPSLQLRLKIFSVKIKSSCPWNHTYTFQITLWIKSFSAPLDRHLAEQHCTKFRSFAISAIDNNADISSAKSQVSFRQHGDSLVLRFGSAQRWFSHHIVWLFVCLFVWFLCISATWQLSNLTSR